MIDIPMLGTYPWWAVALAALVVVWLLWPRASRWEYYVHAFMGSDINERMRVLDEIGTQRWELVNVTPRSGEYNPIAYFRRPLTLRVRFLRRLNKKR